MAKLPALVTALAEVDGRDRPTVDHIARVIREAGYITTGKRGAGAAEMTERHAANLIIALEGADEPKEGPLAIDRFRSLVQYMSGTSKAIKDILRKYDDLPTPIQRVMDASTFGEAFEALIEGVPELRDYLYALANARAGKDVGDVLFGRGIRLDMVGIEVQFCRYTAEIVLFDTVGSHRRSYFEAKFIVDTDRFMDGFYGRSNADRKVSVTIGFQTLVSAWNALNPDNQIAGILAGGDPS